tara:strand:+ start:303 stop:560 length:258 start_codon:yes stop_codon:yes gene_type:complete
MESRCSVCRQGYTFEYKPGKKLPSHFPFCSQRCKSIDLGKWLNGEYRISTSLPQIESLTDTEKEVLAEYLLKDGEVDEILSEEDA